MQKFYLASLVIMSEQQIIFVDDPLGEKNRMIYLNKLKKYWKYVVIYVKLQLYIIYS